jgi:excisionase family DNA binding protein
MGDAVRKQDDLPELVKPERVAEWMGITRHSVYLMVSRGEIPASCCFKIGRRLRFDAAQLRSWLAEKRGSSLERAK